MEELGSFTNFITIETLRSFAGQVLAIVALTQLFKEIPTGRFNPDLRYVALTVALWLQVVTNFLDGWFLTGTLAALNGGIVTLVAMKGAEMLKAKQAENPVPAAGASR